jgi:hypothetical protein
MTTTPEPGDPMLIPCEGGPAMARREHYPPAFEIEVPGGVYVLVDEGAPSSWRYHFIAGDP